MMNDQRWNLVQTIHLVRNDFRNYFGVPFSNKWGHFLDGYLSGTIHSYSNWIDYRWTRKHAVLTGHDGLVHAMAMSNDGRRLFTGSFDKHIKVWDLEDNNAMVHSWEAHRASVSCLCYQRGTLVSGSDDGRVCVWDGHSYTQQWCLEGHTLFVLSVDVNQRGDTVVSGSADKSIRVWSLKSGTCIQVFSGHTGCRVTSVKFFFFSDTHTYHLISGNDGSEQSVHLWDIPNACEQSLLLSEDDSFLTSLKVSDIIVNFNTHLFAIIFQFGFVVLRWPEMKRLKRFRMRVSSVALHPSDPDIIALSRTREYSIQIYHIGVDARLMRLKGHTDTVQRLCFNHDGTRLFSVSHDETARGWDLSRLSKFDPYGPHNEYD